MKIELVKLDDINPDPNNTRRHGERNLAAIKASLSAFGQQKPIVVDQDGVCVAGSGTLEAARALGWPQIAVIRTELGETERRAYAIADNQTAELAEWDEDELAKQLKVLQELDVDLGALGWDGDDLQKLLGPTDGLTDPDDIPAPPVDPITKPGDLWLLGDHRVLCGDATKANTAECLMKATRAALLITSPPYWTNQEYDKKPGVGGAETFMVDIAKAWSDYVIRRVCINTGNTNARSIGQDDSADRVLLDALWVRAWLIAGWRLRTRRMWVKVGQCLHQSPIADCVDDSCEALLTLYRANHSGQERIGEPWATQGWWQLERNEQVVGHPCPYPVELPSRFIRLYSCKNDVVLDPFLGSGTTLIAAEQLGRLCYGIEIEPRYCDVIVKRWEDFTGKKAERVPAGS